MDGKEPLSGMLVKPDGTCEFWWQGECSGCVVPEELIDAVLEASEKSKITGGIKDE